jgi:hypothetical protein
MQVNVIHSLPSGVVAVHDYTVAIVRNAFPGRQFRCGQEQFSDQFGVIRPYVVYGPDVFFGDDQYVRGRLGIYVPEGQDIFIFVDDVGRDFPLDDPEKQVV